MTTTKDSIISISDTDDILEEAEKVEVLVTCPWCGAEQNMMAIKANLVQSHHTCFYCNKLFDYDYEYHTTLKPLSMRMLTSIKIMV